MHVKERTYQPIIRYSIRHPHVLESYCIILEGRPVTSQYTKVIGQTKQQNMPSKHIHSRERKHFMQQHPHEISKSGPEIVKLFPCSTQLSMKFFLLINVKMPTIVGILTFMSRKNSIISLFEPKRSQIS